MQAFACSLLFPLSFSPIPKHKYTHTPPQQFSQDGTMHVLPYRDVCRTPLHMRTHDRKLTTNADRMRSVSKSTTEPLRNSRETSSHTTMAPSLSNTLRACTGPRAREIGWLQERDAVCDVCRVAMQQGCSSMLFSGYKCVRYRASQ